MNKRFLYFLAAGALLLVIFGSGSMLMKSDSKRAQGDIRVTLLATPVRNEVLRHFHEGDLVYRPQGGSALGKLSKVEARPAPVVVGKEAGASRNPIVAESPVESELILVIDGKGAHSGDRYFLNDVEINNNDNEFEIEGPGYWVMTTVIDIALK